MQHYEQCHRWFKVHTESGGCTLKIIIKSNCNNETVVSISNLSDRIHFLGTLISTVSQR